MDQRFAQQRHITRGTKLPRRIQAVNRLERCVGQPQFFRVTIHQTNERLLASGNIIRKRNTGVVTRLDNHTLVEIRDLISGLKEHDRRTAQSRVARGPGVFSYRHHIRELNFSGLQRLPDDVTGHNFGQAGGVQFLVGVAFRQHLAAGIVH